MSIKTVLALFLGWMIIFVSGCGGSGANDADLDPNGAFAMSSTSSLDGDIELVQFAIEMEASKGKITSALARIVGQTFEGETTGDVTGVAEPGLVDLVAQFNTFRVEVKAKHLGIGWVGTYKVWDGKELVDQGDLQITRTDATPRIDGNWVGEFVVQGNQQVADLELDQKGNFIVYSGTIDGIPQVGSGSIIGKSIQFDRRNDTDAGFPNYLGTLRGEADKMSGVGLEATFELDLVKVP